MPNKRFGFCLGFIICFMSCDSNRVFDEYQSVPDQWHKDEVKTFSLEAPDTTNYYNLFINIRNTNDYNYNNLFLIASIGYPNGKVQKDTLEYKMAKPNGELLGKGFTDVKENKLWYKGHEKPFLFAESGIYSISLQHAMRANGNVNGDDELLGITDIGFRVETAESN